MAWPLRDQVCLVGIGETEYKRWGQIERSEFQLACEAIVKAVWDAGLNIRDVDGISVYAGERSNPSWLAGALGIPHLRFSNMMEGGGGGGGSGAILNAAMAIYSGVANVVVAFRSLCQGQYGRFGQGPRGVARISGGGAFAAVNGVMGAPTGVGSIRATRYMHEYGITSRQFGMIAVNSYANAQRNPRAVMYGRPITIEDHQASRIIASPLHLYDCCLENDGAAAIVLVSAERAKSCRQRPVYLMSGIQTSGMRFPSGFNAETLVTSNFTLGAPDLWGRAGIGPKDVDVAGFYENFTPCAMMAMEEIGLCKKGEGGAFVEDGRINWPDGEIPVNTSGGNLAEAYIHGLEYNVENVRQLRGTSTSQVKDAEIALNVQGPAVTPVTATILRR